MCIRDSLNSLPLLPPPPISGARNPLFLAVLIGNEILGRYKRGNPLKFKPSFFAEASPLSRFKVI